MENNRENHPILNQVYNILAELNNQGKWTTLCKVPARMGIKGNEEADKAAKQALHMPGMTIRRARNSTSKLHYIKPHIEE